MSEAFIVSLQPQGKDTMVTVQSPEYPIVVHAVQPEPGAQGPEQEHCEGGEHHACTQEVAQVDPGGREGETEGEREGGRGCLPGREKGKEGEGGREGRREGGKEGEREGGRERLFTNMYST